MNPLILSSDRVNSTTTLILQIWFYLWITQECWNAINQRNRNNIFSDICLIHGIILIFKIPFLFFVYSMIFLNILSSSLKWVVANMLEAGFPRHDIFFFHRNILFATLKWVDHNVEKISAFHFFYCFSHHILSETLKYFHLNIQ